MPDIREAVPDQIPPDLKAKQVSWQRQHAALRAAAYRITLKPRVGRLPPRNFKNEGHKSRGEPERFWTAEDVSGFLTELKTLNVRGYDIYVTPIDETHHYLVIDDVTEARLAEVRAHGFRPCLVQLSSTDNHQVILKTPRQAGPDSQSIANKVIRKLNEAYGDPKFSGVIHPFRLAGFANRKPGKANAFTRLLEASGNICQAATKLVAQGPTDLPKEPSTPKRAPVKPAVRPKMKGDVGIAAAAFLEERRKIQAWVDKSSHVPDESRIDFRAAVSLLKAGWKAELVEISILASPDLANRHENIMDYAKRTVIAARERIGALGEG